MEDFRTTRGLVKKNIRLKKSFVKKRIHKKSYDISFYKLMNEDIYNLILMLNQAFFKIRRPSDYKEPMPIKLSFKKYQLSDMNDMSFIINVKDK